jgi:DNA-binding helix-hairpin-helix protein with protein kinase domain
MPGYCVKIFKPSSRNRYEGNLPKIRKLMACSAEILHDAALPCHLVSETPQSKPVGFVMPEVVGREIHNLYGVSTRQALFPRADFRFLVEVARNAAVSTDRLHKKRLVIGDVSGRNLMVRDNGTVCWIDADSFLIGDPNFTAICELATPEWTAPELQENRHSMSPRLPAHDAFGLAVLIFQLLMLGRHPFQGRFTGTGDTPEIPTSISRRWYAHAGYSGIPFRRTIGTPLIEHVGDQLQGLFLKAFMTDDPLKRPTASDWIPALENLAKNLCRCQQLATHFHLRGHTKCPWCAVMPEFGHEDPFSGAGQIQSGFDDLERNIAAARKTLCTIPGYPNRIFTPTPAAAFQTWQLPKPTGLVGLFAPQTSRRKQTEAMKFQIEKQKSVIVQSLTRNLELQRTLLQQIESGRENLASLAQRAELAINATNLRHSAKLEYERKTLEQQKRNHLARRRLKVGDVSGIGSVRVSQLNGHGIFTAADINSRAIMQLSGFGPASASGLLAWQTSVANSFRQQPIPNDQGQIDSLAKNILNAEKARFEKEQREIKIGIDAILGKATAAAAEAVRLQQETDQANVNLLAIEHALKKLS